MTGPVETQYGLTIDASTTLEIGYYPDSPSACQSDDCQASGHYRGESEALGLPEGRWFCGKHLQDFVALFVDTTEFKRKMRL